jgi:hypothetical protein
MERPTNAGGGLKVLPVEHNFRFVEVGHGAYFIPVIWAEEDRFQGKRAVGNLIRRLERFDRIAAS